MKREDTIAHKHITFKRVGKNTFIINSKDLKISKNKVRVKLNVGDTITIDIPIIYTWGT